MVAKIEHWRSVEPDPDGWRHHYVKAIGNGEDDVLELVTAEMRGDIEKHPTATCAVRLNPELKEETDFATNELRRLAFARYSINEHR